VVRTAVEVANKQSGAVDVMDTCRFMKKFKWYIPNTGPTTTGGEALTADRLVVQNWSTTLTTTVLVLDDEAV
jgi:hypothetical protein